MGLSLKAIKQRYQSLSQVKKATFWITISNFIQKGISFITVPIFTRMLSTSEYGSFSVYQSWEMVAIYIVTLGVTYGGFNNGMVKYKDDKDGYASSIAGLVLTSSVLWILLSLVFQNQVSSIMGMAPLLTTLIFAEVAFRGIYDIWVSRIKYEFSYRKLIAASLTLAVLTPTLGIILVYLMSDKVLGRVMGFVVVEAVFAILLGALLFKKGKKYFNSTYWKFTLLFNIPLLPHYLSQVVLSSADRIMIGSMCSTADAGVYSIAYSTGMLMVIFTTGLNTTVGPWLYHKLDEESYDRISKTSTMLLAVISILALIVDSLAPEIVAILAPDEYYAAMDLVPVIAASVFFMFMYSYCSNIELFYEKTWLATVASVAAAVLNIVLNAALIPVFGYRAAAYTTLACYMAMSLAHYIFAQMVAKKQVGFKLLDGKAIWCIGFVFVVFSVFFSCLYDMPIARYGAILIILFTAIIKRKSLIAKIEEGLS